MNNQCGDDRIGGHQLLGEGIVEVVTLARDNRGKKGGLIIRRSCELPAFMLYPILLP